MPAASVTQPATNKTIPCIQLNVPVRAQSMTVRTATSMNINEQTDMIDDPIAGIRSCNLACVVGSTNDAPDIHTSQPTIPAATETIASRT